MAVRGSNSLFFSTGLDNSGLQSGALDAANIISNLSRTIASINPFAALVVGAAAAFGAVANDAYKMMKEFESAMAEVKTIANVSEGEFKKLEKRVFGLFKELGTESASGLAKGLYDIIGAGYEASDALKILEISSKAATAGVTTSAVAADGLTTILNAFQLEAKDAAKVADIMFATVDRGKISFEELSGQIAQVAPLAASSGFSFEEIAGAIATLTKQGVPASQAMTQIRSAIVSTNEVLGAGVSKSLTLQNAFQALYNKAGGDQNKLQELAGRIEAVSAILAIAGPNAKGAAEDLEAMGDAAGSVNRSFDIITATTDNQFEILTNRIKATTEEIGKSAVTIANGFAKLFNKALDDSDDFTASIRRQANEFNLLRNSLESSNVPFDEKLKILTQLKDQYPEYLRSLDLDKVSNDNLEQTLINVKEALSGINDEQERRLKLSGANQKLINAEAKVQVQKGLFEESANEFYKYVEKIKDYAAKNDIELNFDPSKSPSRILSDIQASLKISNPFGEGGRLLANLTQAEKSIRIFKAELGGANRELTDQEKNLERTKRLTYDNAEGASQIVKEIEQLKSIEDLKTFDNYTNPEINKALKERKNIVGQLSTIKATQDIDSLKPYLKSEIEEVRKYAEERKKLLNTTPPPFNPEDGKKTYSDYLKEKNEEYKKYQAVQNQIGEEAANKQFESLLKLGNSYGDFLKNQLSKTTNFAKMQAIAVEAEVNRLNLNRGEATTVSTIKAQPIKLDLEIDQTSINYIERQITALEKKFNAATTPKERNSLKAQMEVWQKRLDIAKDGSDKEKDLYEDVYRSISNFSYQGIRDYIDYWKKRLKIAGLSAAEEAEITGRIVQAQDQLWDKVVGDISERLGQTAQILRDAGQESVAGMLDGLQSSANQLNSAFKAIRSEDPYEKVNAGIGAAIELTSLLVSASMARKKASEDYYNSVIAQQKEYNQLLNEQLRTQEGQNENVFTTDYENRIKKGVEAYDDAQKSYLESLKELSEGQAKNGLRETISGKNILQAAGAGAALGTLILPGIGTAIGAVAGALAGLFGGKENKPKWVSLLEEYPELITTAANGQQGLNAELAQTLINQDLVNDKTKILIEDTLAWQEAMEAAQEQIKGVISDLAGSLGSDLRNSLVEAFQAGESAAMAMGDTISNVLQDILSQLIFDKIFSEQFKKLEDQMTDSFSPGGDGTWVDDFQRFFEESKGLTDQFNSALAQARDIAENAGFDVFGATDSNRGGMSGAIKNITEDTANILEGYLNAIRLDTRQGVLIAEQSIIYLSEISQNTRYNRFLESIDNRMATVENGILEFQSRA